MAKKHHPLLLLLLSLLLLFIHPSNAGSTYDPTTVDWSSVVDACASSMRYERRLGSFALRSAFHDAGSLTPTCAASPSSTCGGADGSLMVSAAEQLHGNNVDELFSSNTAQFVLPIAKRYGASVADTLYVCALVAPSILASSTGPANLGPSPRSVRTDPVLRSAVAAGFKVGRIDRTTSGPDGNDPSLLPMATLSLTEFSDWFTSRGISLEDAGALLGVHTLLRPKGCFVEGKINQATGQPNWCVPFGAPGKPMVMPGDSGPFTIAKGSCPMVSMMRWSNEWFVDLCGTRGEGAFDITDQPAPTEALKLGEPGFAQQVANSVCGYRSEAFRADAKNRQLSGKFVTSPAGRAPTVIDWECPASGCKSNPRTFFFTENDAHLGNACHAGALLSPAPASSSSPDDSLKAAAASAAVAEVAASPAAAALMEGATLNPAAADDVELVKALRASFLEYTGTGGQKQWNLDFGIAFVGMSSLGAQWADKAFAATLTECPSGWVHGAAVDTPRSRQFCAKRCAKGSGARPSDCPDFCRCSTAPRALKTEVVPATGAVTAAP
jgi:hypothetical protein